VRRSKQSEPCAAQIAVAAAISAPQPDDSSGLLSALLERKAPSLQLGQIAVGTVGQFVAEGQVLVQVPGLEAPITAASLVPLLSGHIGQKVAVTLTARGPALILGLVWDGAQQLDLNVDGERHLIRAEHEIELRCGEAAIVLNADGRIDIRGTYITSHASASQRILGGSVSVN